MSTKKPITLGGQFGRLTFVKIAKTGKHKYGLFSCECSATKECRIDHILSGRIVSCGCNKRMGRHSRTHGQSKTHIYGVWCSMIRRCCNQHEPSYARYGGRGITVCKAWRESFEQFAIDMGAGRPGMSIDRINNDGPYEPGNCRWATATEQSLNRRNNVIVEWNGKRQPLSLWAQETGLSYGTLHSRIARGETAPRLFRAPGVNRLPRPKIGRYRRRKS